MGISYLVPIIVKSRSECPKSPLFGENVEVVPGTANMMEVLQTHGRIPASNTLYKTLGKVECLIIDNFACMNIHDVDLLDSLYMLLRSRIDDHLSPKTKKKIRSTFVTTHHHLEDWPRHLIGDDFKVLQIINILYGRGTLLSIDEKAPRIEEDETDSSSSEATR